MTSLQPGRAEEEWVKDMNQTRGRDVLLRLLLGLVCGALLSVLVPLGYFIASGGPLADEWDCVKGEFPATDPQGSTFCLPYGTVLEAGWTADPRGNQRR